MKPRAVLKLAVDILMTLLLLFLMGYQFWGQTAHEWVGAGIFILFIAHHILNFGWHKNIFKGKYTALRIITLCIDLLVLLAMLAQMYIGIVMSRYVFDFLPINGGMSIARRLHILGAYWGFIFMSLHLCLYAPWGNLSIFYKDFHNSNGLISLGHIDSGIDIIGDMSEDFSALLEKME